MTALDTAINTFYINIDVHTIGVLFAIPVIIIIFIAIIKPFDV